MLLLFGMRVEVQKLSLALIPIGELWECAGPFPGCAGPRTRGQAGATFKGSASLAESAWRQTPHTLHY